MSETADQFIDVNPALETPAGDSVVAAAAVLENSPVEPFDPQPIQQAIAETVDRGDAADAAIKNAILQSHFRRVIKHAGVLAAGGAMIMPVVPDGKVGLVLGASLGAGAVIDGVWNSLRVPHGRYLGEWDMPPAIRLETYRYAHSKDGEPNQTLLWARLPIMRKGLPEEVRPKLFRETLSLLGEQLSDVDFDTIAVPARLIREAGLSLSPSQTKLNPEELFKRIKGVLPYAGKQMELESPLAIFTKQQFEQFMELKDASLLLQLLRSLASRQPGGMVALIMDKDVGLNKTNYSHLKGALKTTLKQSLASDSMTGVQLNPRLHRGGVKKIRQGLRAQLREEEGDLYVHWLDEHNLSVSRTKLLEHLGFSDPRQLLALDFEKLPKRKKTVYEAAAAFHLLKSVDVSGNDLIPLSDKERAEYQDHLKRPQWTWFAPRTYEVSEEERANYLGKLARIAAVGAAATFLFFGWEKLMRQLPKPFTSPQVELVPQESTPPSQARESGSARAETPEEKLQREKRELVRLFLILGGLAGAMAVGAVIGERKTIYYRHNLKLQDKSYEDLLTKDLDSAFGLLDWVSFGYPETARPSSKATCTRTSLELLTNVTTKLPADGMNRYLQAPHIFDSVSGSRASFSQRRTNRALAKYVQRAHKIQSLRADITRPQKW